MWRYINQYVTFFQLVLGIYRLLHFTIIFVIQDPAIGANDTSYRPYDWGNKLNVFIKDGDTGENLFGKVSWSRENVHLGQASRFEIL